MRELQCRQGAWVRLTGVAVGIALFAASSGASADPIADAEVLVRQSYFEGLPYDEVTALSPSQVARLAEMLADPGEAAHHGNIVLALGMSGQPTAFRALRAFAETPVAGEVGRDVYRARTRIPLSMGHLARTNRRALNWLLNEAGRHDGAPSWTFRHQRGERLGHVLREQVLTGLAVSGAEEALPALERAAAEGNDRRALHVARVRQLHGDVRSRGARAVFGARAAASGPAVGGRAAQ